MIDILATALGVTLYILVVLVFWIAQLHKRLNKEKTSAKFYRDIFLRDVKKRVIRDLSANAKVSTNVGNVPDNRDCNIRKD